MSHEQQQKQHNPAQMQQEGESESMGGQTMAAPAFALAANPVQRKPNPDSSVPPLQGWFGEDIIDRIGDGLNLRENEAELDLWEDYQAAKADLQEFIAKEHTSNNFIPDTGLGMFDISYSAASGILTLTCKSKFNFIDGQRDTYDPGQFDNANDADFVWTEEAKEAWKARFLSECSGAWTGQHTFWAQKDWWESIKATTNVEFIAVETGQHFTLNITKIPEHEDDGGVGFARSSVGRPSKNWFGGVNPGTGTFDSNDLTGTNKPGGNTPQMPAVHEAGHMLGLGDEYEVRAGHVAQHDGLVHDEFGTSVVVGSDDRIMSGGNAMNNEHGVTFLNALRNATGMDEWGFDRKDATPVPMNPNMGPADYIPQDPNGPRYA